MVLANVFFPSAPFEPFVPLVPASPFGPWAPVAPVDPVAPCWPIAPLHIYFVKVAFTSLPSNVPLLSVSNPYSTFTPPVVQFTPAASVVVFTIAFWPFVPFVPLLPAGPVTPCNPWGPWAPIFPWIPCEPVAPLQTYFVNAAFTSVTSNVPSLLASKPYSTFTPPVVQFIPADSDVVLVKVFLPSTPLEPFVPFVPLFPFAPAGPVDPIGPCAPINEIPEGQTPLAFGPNNLLLAVLI